MKIFVLMASFLLSMSSMAATAQAFRSHDLGCELVDVDSGRVFNWKRIPIVPSAKNPIVALLSYGNVTGSVRDFPGSIPAERQIELILDYWSPNRRGQDYSSRIYRLDQADIKHPVASVYLEGSIQDFGESYTLRCFVVPPKVEVESVDLSTTLLTALSVVTYEYGSGQASSYCDGNSGWYCLDQVKQRARQEAVRNAEWSCSAKRGQADALLPNCNDFCTPYSLPPSSPSQVVSCSSNCTIRCTIP
jgi:hypothetical protein